MDKKGDDTSKNQEDREKFKTFHAIDTQALKLYLKGDQNLSTSFNLKSATIPTQIFHLILPDSLIDRLIEINVDRHASIPALFFKNKLSKNKNIQREKRNLVIRYFACKLFILSNPNRALIH
jgi:hypothetical protein